MTFTVEERQEQNAKRRKLEATTALSSDVMVNPVPSSGLPDSLVDSIPGLTLQQSEVMNIPQEMPQSHASVREANIQALRALKNEKSSIVPANNGTSTEIDKTTESPTYIEGPIVTNHSEAQGAEMGTPEVADYKSGIDSLPSAPLEDTPMETSEYDDTATGEKKPSRSLKRTFEEMEDDNGAAALSDESDTPPLTIKVNPDGTAEQADTVRYVHSYIRCDSLILRRLWEPGYKERYYQQKFKISLEEVEIRQK